uniref:Uncharacterized protein n=1 Tax=Pristionchus pacificus TaxID=54126 RepID=A0A2A6CUV2_PRIPA|eukprot:PDM81827.1 hypothetical protein PRIPAC_33981 [Pristionchus pacificus]
MALTAASFHQKRDDIHIRWSQGFRVGVFYVSFPFLAIADDKTSFYCSSVASTGPLEAESSPKASVGSRKAVHLPTFSIHSMVA